MPSNYVLLQRIELNASAASVTFSSIPQTGYTDLKVVWSGRLSDASTATYCKLTFNGSAANFTAKRLAGSGSATTSGDLPQWSGTAPGTNATSNTFSNVEFYIPNYTSSNYKSYSLDTVTENNATEAYAELGAGLWSDTAAITSITLTGNAGSFLQYSTFSLYGLADVNTTPAIAPKASGGSITTDGTYWIHTFNSTGTFTPAVALTCDYLVVAGGGGGGGSAAGGGGAGGLRSTVTATGGGGSLESALTLTASTNYTVTVGAGGAVAAAVSTKGTSGANSIFSTITATGGGGGGAFTAVDGLTGGSGGGGGFATGVGGTGTTNQGFAGQAFVSGDSSSNFIAGAGGGAGATGSGGTGGNGVATSITGSSVTYAGGGGGGVGFDVTAKLGGSGGGGTGSRRNTSAGTSGTANTGGGGGAADLASVGGGNGGSGIVIIRYTIA
jgi:hypothetical protein